jgi:hypothetical protein
MATNLPVEIYWLSQETTYITTVYAIYGFVSQQTTIKLNYQKTHWRAWESRFVNEERLKNDTNSDGQRKYQKCIRLQ